MHRNHAVARLAARCLSIAMLFVFAPRGAAQCATQWLPGTPWNGTDGEVRAMTNWDPDGPGPASPRLVMGGSLSTAGEVAATNIATFDPVSSAWSALGEGMPLGVDAVTTLANGDLVACGGFSTFQIKRWTGSNWVSLGADPNGQARGLLALPNGDLIASGAFTTIGGVSAPGIARWNGTTWSSLGTGFPTVPFPGINALALLANGDVVAVANSIFGAFEMARWNGSSWSPVANGTGQVTALTTTANGDLVAAGTFASIGGVAANAIARWNGTSWSALGTGFSLFLPLEWPRALLELPNGDVLVGGSLSNAGGVSVSNVARWNGTSWSTLGTGTNATVNAWATLPNGDIVAGGAFTTAGGIDARSVARWNGSSWSPVDPVPITDGIVSTVTSLPGGDVVVGGQFTVLVGVPAGRVARWNGSTFLPLGTGMNAPVTDLATAQNGEVIASGSFTTADGAPANRIARWNGLSWLPLGVGMDAAVNAVAVLPNGDIVAGGAFLTAGGVSANRVARWNGTTWTPLGGGMTATVTEIAVMPNGNVVVNQDGSGAIWRWNGTAWTAIGVVNRSLPFPPFVTPGDAYALLPLPDGSLVVGGNFSLAGGTPVANIARLSGTAFSPLGALPNGFVTALTRTPDGDIVSVGGAPASVTPAGIYRWDGSWSPVGGGLGGGSVGSVTDMTWSTTGDLIAVGTIGFAGATASRDIARLTTTCPATAVPFAAGCASSGGSNSLVAANLPWVESTFLATGTGLPTTALVVTLTSVSPIPQGVAPLAGVFLQSPPGCDVLVTPDILGLLTTTTGTVTSSLLLPNVPPLVGVVFYHQLIPFETDALGNIVAITATNSLQLTAGAF